MHRLKERIKQQEGATARVQEMLQGLEARLGQPETAYPALVFYQLRELWRLGRTLLTQFVAELAAQQEERERRAFFAEHNRLLFDRRQGVEGALRRPRIAPPRRAPRWLSSSRSCRRCAASGITSAAARCASGCRRRSLQSLLCVQDLEAARGARDALEAEPQPEFGGLSLDARRAINLAAIAYGQVLCDRLARTGLVELARDATVTARAAARGLRRSCELRGDDGARSCSARAAAAGAQQSDCRRSS